jgi:glyoxylase-like metal-dependent hydrolase (beta-lactamase superfamily II)
MKLGSFELTTISGGRFWTDGGGMFGIIPKPLWSRLITTDELNRIPQGTNCVLVRTGTNTVLIDTGYGSKIPAKQLGHMLGEAGDPLVASLDAAGVKPDEIDTVILSHLHFDHAGGATRIDENGKLVDSFPNAQYIVQKEEWESATGGHVELRNAYPQENILPLAETGRLKLIEGDIEILPGIRSIVTGGHTRAQQVIVIESEGEGAMYLADACPTWRHLPQLWCMSYDEDLLQARRIKPVLLGQIADNGWWGLSDHDPDHAAARIRRDDRREFVVTESLKAM